MKKTIRMLPVAIIGLLLASCGVQQEVEKSAPVNNTAASLPPPPKTVSAYGDDVEGIQGRLVNHPDSNSLRAIDGFDYYLLYDLPKKCLYVTVHKNVYRDIVDWLPVKRIPTHWVSIDAPIINALTLFTPEQLAEESKKIGVALNKFKMGKIYNYNLEDSEIPDASKKSNAAPPPPAANDRKPANGRPAVHVN